MAGVRLKSSATFKTDVKFVVMSAEGKTEPMSYQAEFKRLSQEEVKQLLKEREGDREMLREVLVGWKMRDLDSGESIPFSAEVLEEALAIPGFASVSMLRYVETVGASREKN